MVSIGISEFTFGHAFLSEQVNANWGNLVAAPILPSLLQEADDGWDARLPMRGVDFYYQFKLSDYMANRNSKFFSETPYYKSPYYRISLHKKDFNRQHRTLYRLSMGSPHTYYVAPAFNCIEDFNDAFLNGQIANSSKLIPVRGCRDYPSNDGDQHYITFQAEKDDWYQHSETLHGKHAFSGKNLSQLYHSTQESWQPINEEFVQSLFKKVRSAISESLEPKEILEWQSSQRWLSANLENLATKDLLKRVSELLSIAFGVTLVLVGSRT